MATVKKITILFLAFVVVLCGGGAVIAGEVVAWGQNSSSQCDVPEPNEGFIAVAGGNYHSLGLKDDGSIVAWGGNDDGQCDVPEPNDEFVYWWLYDCPYGWPF